MYVRYSDCVIRNNEEFELDFVTYQKTKAIVELSYYLHIVGILGRLNN